MVESGVNVASNLLIPPIQGVSQDKTLAECDSIVESCTVVMVEFAPAVAVNVDAAAGTDEELARWLVLAVVDFVSEIPEFQVGTSSLIRTVWRHRLRKLREARRSVRQSLGLAIARRISREFSSGGRKNLERRHATQGQVP
jgi:hypothetical protein